MKDCLAIRLGVSALLTAAMALGLGATPAQAQTCSAPNVQQSFTNSSPAGTGTGTVQSFTVPAGVTSITIDALGAQGGRVNSPVGPLGGKGAEVAATVPVTGGGTLCIVTGVQGGNGPTFGGGGGGGSFVYSITSGTCASNLPTVSAANLLIAAGGGGGAAGGGTFVAGNPGLATGLGSSGSAPFSLGGGAASSSGGTGGNGGASSGGGGGAGGGLLSNGANGACGGAGAGLSLNNGATGGSNSLCTGGGNGGYGGGGAGAGGGGGYNGGSGGSSVPTASAGGGSFSAVAPSFAQDGQQTGNGAVNLCYMPPSTTTTVTSSANPSVFAQSVTFTATVAPQSGSGTPTGSVIFTIDGVDQTPVTLSVGQASLTFLLSVGAHTVSAAYGGDAGFLASSGSLAGGQIVTAPVAATITKSFTPSTVVFNGSSVATITVTNPNASSLTNVQFSDTMPAGIDLITQTGGTCSTLATGGGTFFINPGTETFSSTSSVLTAGQSCNITVSVRGTVVGSHVNTTSPVTSSNAPPGTAASGTLIVTKAATTTVLTASPNPSVINQPVTFTATVTVVSPGTGTPTGTVTFKDGATTIGTGTLNGSGVATVTTSSLSLGPHSMTAVYGGDTNFDTSPSSAQSQTVNQAGSSTTLASSVNPSVVGQSITFTATVTVVSPGAGTPTGTATFKDDVTTIGTGTVDGSGSATFTTSTLSAGTHSITVVYSGDTNFVTSTSSAVSQVVGKASQTIAFGPLPGKLLGSAPFTVSATASSGLAVTFQSLTTPICDVSGSAVTLFSVGTCTIAARQLGDSTYNAAPEVPQSFTVTANCSVPALPGTLPSGQVALPYDQTLTLTNGTGAITWALSGALPSGVTFSDGVFTGTPAVHGAFPITVTATDANSCQVSASYPLSIGGERRLVIGAARDVSTVRAFNIGSATVQSEISAFGMFAGGVAVAQGDVDGNGIADIVVGAGPGEGPAVRALDGASSAARLTFFAFDPAYRGGVTVAAGDVTGDGLPEIIAATGCAGGPHVRAFDGRTGALVRAYTIPLPVPTCRLNVASGDVNGDGVADVIVGAGDLGASFVDVVDGVTGSLLRELYPFGTAFTGGVNVAAGDVTGDGLADIVTGAGPGGTPHVRVFDGTTGSQIPGALGSFHAYVPLFSGGVRVGAGDLNGDGRAEVLTVPAGNGGPHVRVFDGASATEIYGLYGFDPSFGGGLFVAGPTPSARMNVDIAARTSGAAVRIAGWALREIANDTTGTDAIHVWAYPVSGGAPVFVGDAPTRVPRPDLAAAFGGQFLMSGFDFSGTLAAGTYDLVIYVRNSRTLIFDLARVIRVTVN